MADEAPSPDTPHAPGQQYALPTPETLASAGDLKLLDEQGISVHFRTLYTPPASSPHTRHLVVFIRHFYCGMCEAYVRMLSTHLAPSTLATVDADLTIIGCGQTDVVADYKQRTGCPFPIYCDPERRLYAKLGMVVNTKLGEQPGYAKQGFVVATLSSAWHIVSSGKKAFGGGDYGQNGGELLFEGSDLRWCHWMRNTRDHAEVGELRMVLGLAERQ
ncbi:hypothetical protein LTR08_002873 [Meristemomyces frigidus]|nr:hypothetical protein LTR08_002873 [Meristemomyces frigidus]